MKVIIVDDEPLARSRMARLLSAESVDVVAQCENGEQAIEAIRSERPDIVFMDINMPKMDGLTAVEKLNELTEELPAIIFCTAHPEHAISAFRKGAANYLLKPVTQSDLKDAIERAKNVTKLQINEMSSADSNAPVLAVNVDGVIERLAIYEFVYFFLQDRHVFGVLQDGKRILVDYSLTQIQNKYHTEMVRVNRTNIVNINYVNTLNTKERQLEFIIGGETITMTASRRQVGLLKKLIAPSN